jgi:hypothetical protein
VGQHVVGSRVGIATPTQLRTAAAGNAQLHTVATGVQERQPASVKDVEAPVAHIGVTVGLQTPVVVGREIGTATGHGV